MWEKMLAYSILEKSSDPHVAGSKMFSWVHSCPVCGPFPGYMVFKLKRFGTAGLRALSLNKNSCMAFLQVLAGFAVMHGLSLSDFSLFNYQIVSPFFTVSVFCCLFYQIYVFVPSYPLTLYFIGFDLNVSIPERECL